VGGSLTIKVECYSSSEYTNRPMVIVIGEQRFTVVKLLTENYTPEGKHFRVELDDGRVLDLSYLEVEDTWKAAGLV
jgi:hypothetical protein